MKIKPGGKRFFLYPTIMFVLIVLAFHRWLVTPVISWGDWAIINPDRFDLFFKWPYFLTGGQYLGGINNFYMSRTVMNTVYAIVSNSLHFGTQLTTLFFFFIFPVVAAPWGMWRLIKLIGGTERIAFFASLIYIFNTKSVLFLLEGHINGAIGYALMPWILYWVLRILNENRGSNIWYLSITVTIQAIIEPRTWLITVPLVALWLMGQMIFYPKYRTLRSIKKIFFSAIYLLLLNLYWIYPFLFQSSNQSILMESGYTSYSWVKALSYNTFLDTLSLFNVSWPLLSPNFITSIPIVYLFIFLSFFAFWRVKNRSLLLLIVIGFVGSFFAKGANPPFGEVYEWFFQNIPGFVGFRDPAKFYLFSAVGLAAMFAFGTDQLIIIFNKSKVKYFQYLIWVYLVAYLLVIFLPLWSQSVGGTLTYRKQDTSVQDYLDEQYKQSNWFRIFWLPTYYKLSKFTPNYDNLFGNDPFVVQTIVNRLPGLSDLLRNNTKNNYLSYFLDAYGIKYVAIPGDALSDIYGIGFNKPQDYYVKQVIGNHYFDHIDRIIDSYQSTTYFLHNETALGRVFTSKNLIMMNGEPLFADNEVSVNPLDNVLLWDDLETRTQIPYSLNYVSLQSIEPDEWKRGTTLEKTFQIKRSTAQKEIRFILNKSNVAAYSLNGLSLEDNAQLESESDNVQTWLFDKVADDNADVKLNVAKLRSSQNLIDMTVRGRNDWQPCTNEYVPGIEPIAINNMERCVVLIINSDNQKELFIDFQSYRQYSDKAYLYFDFRHRGDIRINLNELPIQRFLTIPKETFQELVIAIVEPIKTSNVLNPQKLSEEIKLISIDTIDKNMTIKVGNSKFASATATLIMDDDYVKEVNIDSSSNLPILLTLSDGYHKGWVAETNSGQLIHSIPTLLNQNLFILPANTDNVRLMFQPVKLLMVTSYVSLFAFVLGTLLLLMSIFARVNPSNPAGN